MIDLLIYLAIFVILAIVIWWILSQVPLPEPFKQIILILFVVIAAVIVISILLGLVGHGPALGLHL